MFKFNVPWLKNVETMMERSKIKTIEFLFPVRFRTKRFFYDFTFSVVKNMRVFVCALLAFLSNLEDLLYRTSLK